MAYLSIDETEGGDVAGVVVEKIIKGGSGGRYGKRGKMVAVCEVVVMAGIEGEVEREERRERGLPEKMWWKYQR
ncbi:hypothetical protein LguiA_027874 [Lonicera macranthoides]